MPRATFLIFAAGAALGLAGCQVEVGLTSAGDSEPMKTEVPGSELGNLVANYKKWTKVNPKPVHMEPFIAALCRGPMSWETKENPHQPKYFTVYVNEKGKVAMFKSGPPTFPVDSVIVKEKLPSETSDQVELMTVMVKRAKGFDPKHGDWEYFTTRGVGPETSQDDVAKCQSCHESAKSNDYVFRSYEYSRITPLSGSGKGG